MSKAKVAFIGLGVMGSPMAGHLKTAGYEIKVYNRTTSRAEQWCANYEGTIAATPREAAIDADIVFVCVGNDDDVRSVIYGDSGVLAGATEGTIIVDHTTTSAILAVELAEACQNKNISFIDAPVSGGQAGAVNGLLTVMCGGDEAIFNQVKPVINAYSKQITLLGENGQGQRCKMVNQVCIAGLLQGLSEGLALAEKSGLNVEQVVDTLKHGAAGSWQMENRSVTMSQREFDFGFAIDWMRKDLDICLTEAKEHQLSLPITEYVDNQYKALQHEGFGRMDTSMLIKKVTN
ncbi:MAG: NAD(P)-dependent oxidoreductase [Aliivibrio sp.]|nr:NAD(P)-dependent oxidoreductase [Aliivibrio sp.]